jgi:hypothetical protein
MQRRRVRRVVLALGALLIGVIAWQWYFDHSITAADVDRIRSGMTLEEVLIILHPSPTAVNGQPLPATANEMTWDEIAIPLGRPGSKQYRLDWEQGSDCATVFFDDTGNVYGKVYFAMNGIQRLCLWWIRRFGTLPPF